MVYECVVRGCNNYVGKKPNLSFHRFPLQDSKRIILWLRAINRVDWTPTKFTKICSDHFVYNDYKLNGLHLNENAVPSQYLPLNIDNVVEQDLLSSSDIPYTDHDYIKCKVDPLALTESEEIKVENEDYISSDECIVLGQHTNGKSNSESLIPIESEAMVVDKEVYISCDECVVLGHHSKGVQTAPMGRDFKTSTNLALKKKIKALHQTLRRKNKQLAAMKKLLAKEQALHISS